MVCKKISYNVINIFAIMATILLFLHNFWDVHIIFRAKNIYYILLLIAIVLLVHTIKAVRLYLALYGSDLKGISYIKTYCKTTSVSMVIPLKAGEFFRMYCYGKWLGVMKGVVVVLLDRFMDTLALVTVIFLVKPFDKKSVMLFAYILFAFLVFVVSGYFIYPGIHRFWKQYLLRAKASENTLAMLRVLENLNKIYAETENVVRGRGVMLYLMSLMAWGVEIGGMILLNVTSGGTETASAISCYLTSAMMGNSSSELKQFIFISVIFLVIVYFTVKLYRTVEKGKNR